MIGEGEGEQRFEELCKKEQERMCEDKKQRTLCEIYTPYNRYKEAMRLFKIFYENDWKGFYRSKFSNEIDEKLRKQDKAFENVAVKIEMINEDPTHTYKHEYIYDLIGALKNGISETLRDIIKNMQQDKEHQGLIYTLTGIDDQTRTGYLSFIERAEELEEMVKKYNLDKEGDGKNEDEEATNEQEGL